MFNLVSKYKPSGDQPEAIKKLVDGIMRGRKSKYYLVQLVLVRLLQWQMLLKKLINQL